MCVPYATHTHVQLGLERPVTVCMDNSGMLQRLRQRRNLHTVVFTVLALAWLIALGAGGQARAAMPSLLPPDVCTASPDSLGHGGGHGGDLPAGSSHHSDPDCLLCIALAAPPLTVLAPARSPAPAVAAWRAQAPLPARGPPANFLA